MLFCHAPTIPDWRLFLGKKKRPNSCWPHDLHLITPTIWSHMALMLLPCLLYYVGFNYCVSCLSLLPFAEGEHSQKFRHLKLQWNIYCIFGVTKASIIDGGNEGASLALLRTTQKNETGEVGVDLRLLSCGVLKISLKSTPMCLE